MKKLSEKRVLITGGTTGIGMAAAKLFHEHGAKVIVTGRNEATLAAARDVLPKDVGIIRSDASRVSDVRELAQEVKRRWDGVDVLFLNAGTARITPLGTVTEELFDEIVDVNFKGVFFAAQEFAPLMARGGSMILNTSIASHWKIPVTPVYAASKGALRALIRSLAIGLAPQGVRVNGLCPGLIETPIFGKIGLPPSQVAELATTLVANIPLGRPGAPEEVAKAALFLASDDSSYVVGEDLVIDGGFTMT